MSSTTKSNLFTSSDSEVTLMSETGAVRAASDRCGEEGGGEKKGKRDRLHRQVPNFLPMTGSASRHRRTSCSPSRRDSLQKPNGCFNDIRFQLERRGGPPKSRTATG